jgi:4-alpha-glucanotransferase
MRFQRSAGILLHLTSLPGPYGNGDLGPSAYHFVDWLVLAGQRIWQMLPLGPGGLANSPYMSLSAFAGNPLVIDLEDLKRHGWLTDAELASAPSFPEQKVDYAQALGFRARMLWTASRRFFAGSTAADRSAFEAFCKAERSWLDDYALFQALNEAHGQVLWTSWPKPLVHREPAALKAARREHEERVRHHEFVQWCFRRQWDALKRYANERNVRLIGDIPIFVAHHSSDVWSHQDLFHLDGNGDPTVVAGVPPDYFSVTGQRWGNPLYRWKVMEEKRFKWWVERFRATLALFDIVRVDHFRGFEAYWEIPATEKTAVKGRWVKAPGEALFRTVKRQLKDLPIIAEDLGVITPEVTALRDGFELPGMKVLQFAFAGGPENAFLPHNYGPHFVVYTGTHDNDTTVGWSRTATDHEREFAERYLGVSGPSLTKAMIRAALNSVADLAVVPFQDVLELGTEHRMNLPGTTDGNWEWRFSWSLVGPQHAERLYEWTALANRCPPDRLTLPAYPRGRVQP